MALSIAVPVVGLGQQSFVAVLDTLAVAVMELIEHVLVTVELRLPYEQIVQRLVHVLVTDALELP